jgi:hypothetical protein
MQASDPPRHPRRRRGLLARRLYLRYV